MRFPTVPPFRPRLRPSDESGLTLIEVMLSALIVILLAAATATALIETARASGDEQFRSEADSLAAQDQEQLRGLSDEQLNALQLYTQSGGRTGTSRTHTEKLGGITFTVTSTASFNNASSASGCSASAATSFDTTSTVTWMENGHQQKVVDPSLLTRPVIGQVVARVLDTSGNPLSGATVVLVDADPTAGGLTRQTVQTDQNGCAFFAGLTPGTYTATVSLPGYISSGTPATVAVSAAGTSPPSFTLALSSGPINATFQAASGATGEADGILWEAAGSTTLNVSTGPAGTASPAESSASGLYPGAYSVWAGRCAGQVPPAGTTGTAGSVTVPAGQPAPVVVPEPALQVSTVTYPVVTGSFFGFPITTTESVKPADIVLTYTAISGTACTDSWRATVTSASGTTSSQGTIAPAGGWLANPGQPYAPVGTLTVCADYYDSTTNSYYHASYPSTTRQTLGNASFSTTATAVPSIAITKTTGTGQCPVSTS